MPGAWLAAAIFAVHPVEVESVAWVTERKNVLSLTLALSSMLAYFRFDPPEADAIERPRDNRWRWYAAALVLFALALFAKTVVVTLPAVLVVIYWWKRGRVREGDIAYLLPFFALSIAMGLMTRWVETHLVGAEGADWSLTAVERFLLAGRPLWFYAAKLAWPHPLMFFYPSLRSTPDSGGEYLFPLAAVGCRWRYGAHSFPPGARTAGGGVDLQRRDAAGGSASSTSTSCCTRRSRTIFNTMPAWP